MKENDKKGRGDYFSSHRRKVVTYFLIFFSSYHKHYIFWMSFFVSKLRQAQLFTFLSNPASGSNSWYSNGSTLKCQGTLGDKEKNPPLIYYQNSYLFKKILDFSLEILYTILKCNVSNDVHSITFYNFCSKNERVTG